MIDSFDENKELVGEFTFVPGDNGVLSINDNELFVNVNTNSCYRVLIYKFISNFSL